MAHIDPATPTHLNVRLRGIGFAVLGFTMWVLADSAIKLAGESALPAYEIMAFQGLLIALFLIAYRVVGGDTGLLWPTRPARQIVRAILDTANVLCVVIALRHLPLDLFYILVFSSPMVVATMAPLVLREPLHLRDATAILVGFIGVLIAVRPSSPHNAGDRVGYMACALAVVCFSSSIVWSRRMTQSERLDSMIFTTASVMAMIGFVAMFWHAETPNYRVVILLPLISATVGLGNLFVFQALRSVSAATVSQYHYSQLLSGAIIAWLIWHERPTMAMLVGASLIIGSGLSVASRADPPVN